MKQEGKDVKGRNVCLQQEQKFLQAKKKKEGIVDPHFQRSNRNKEAKARIGSKVLDQKKKRRKEEKKLRRKATQRQDQGPVSLQPFFPNSESYGVFSRVKVWGRLDMCWGRFRGGSGAGNLSEPIPEPRRNQFRNCPGTFRNPSPKRFGTCRNPSRNPPTSRNDPEPPGNPARNRPGTHPEPPRTFWNPSRNRWNGTLPRNRPGTGTQPPEPSRNHRNPAGNLGTHPGTGVP